MANPVNEALPPEVVDRLCKKGLRGVSTVSISRAYSRRIDDCDTDPTVSVVSHGTKYRTDRVTLEFICDSGRDGKRIRATAVLTPNQVKNFLVELAVSLKVGVDF